METKKELGQHFLINEGVAQRIASLLKDENLILEVGGGRGALTEKLINLNTKIVVLELDRDMVSFLKKRFEKVYDFYLIRGDGRNLKVRKECSVCGNLPYNMAKPIIKNFIKQFEFVRKMVFMVQREVAETIVAESGSRSFNKFSVLCQLYYTTKKVFDVKPGSFNPKPRVDSSVVVFERKPTYTNINSTFFRFLDKLFSHPRKTVKNNLKMDLGNSINMKRPSDLTIDEIIEIWRKRWQAQ